MAVFTQSCIFLLCCILTFLGFASAQIVPTVSTSSGLLRGFLPQPNVAAYLGIPYASPPTGPLRFAPPQPYRSANNASVLDCYHFSPGSFQIDYATAFGAIGTPQSENMLTLNIWAPAKTSKRQGLLPVLIFLYGGGFTQGSTAQIGYNGQDLVAEHNDMIFVTINYRVNIFGFPNTPALDMKNPGLRDQRLAVEWLRDNIAALGGDAKRMTLSGQSAGSMSAAYWSYAYSHDPIVSALVEFSGQPGLVATDDGTSWTTLANKPGCANADREAELQCMRGVKARQLKTLMSPNNIPAFTNPVISGGTPVVDNETVFVLDEYAARGKAGKFAKLVCPDSPCHE